MWGSDYGNRQQWGLLHCYNVRGHWACVCTLDCVYKCTHGMCDSQWSYVCASIYPVSKGARLHLLSGMPPYFLSFFRPDCRARASH